MRQQLQHQIWQRSGKHVTDFGWGNRISYSRPKAFAKISAKLTHFKAHQCLYIYCHKWVPMMKRGDDRFCSAQCGSKYKLYMERRARGHVAWRGVQVKVGRT